MTQKTEFIYKDTEKVIFHSYRDTQTLRTEKSRDDKHRSATKNTLSGMMFLRL